MKFERYLIDDSFDLKSTKPTKKVTPERIRDLIAGTVDDAGQSLYVRNELKKVRILSGYTFEYDDEFLVFFVRTKEGVEVHFANLSQGEFNLKTSSLDVISINVFSTVVKTIVDFVEKGYNGKILIISVQERSSFYEKIINKVLPKHLPNWIVTGTYKNAEGKNVIEIKPNILEQSFLKRGKLSTQIQEASYVNNLGFEEMMLFFKKANAADQKKMEDAVENENWEMFKYLIKKVLKVTLK